MRTLVSIATVKLVPGRQGLTREEIHPFDPVVELPQGRSPVRTVDVIVNWLDNKAHLLGFSAPG